MKNKILILGVAISSISFSQVNDTITCVATTTKGKNCKIVVKNSKLCRYHGGDTTKVVYISHQCISFTNDKSRRCKVITRHPSEICHHHRPKK